LRNVTIHINYKNDTLHGTYQIYDSRERLRFSVDFYHGLEEGPAYLYSKRGRVIRTYFYDSSAVRLVALHKRSRNPYLIFEVENGVKDGYEISFGIFGRIKYVSFYEEGKQKKVQTSYNWRYREHYSIYYKK
jgi:antitoxin component YwqK of YwqJK toxin-antitoxin module